ncbi:MAG: insulinase family protein [Planctomycetota bacterium]|nr:insulinase family protein [Planctomycetota bacterium]
MRRAWIAVLTAVVAASLPRCGEEQKPVLPGGGAGTGTGPATIIRPIEGSKQVALIVLYSIGGDHDPEGRSGLAHLIEHLYVTAAAGEQRSRTIDEFVARYPMSWNAQTGDRYTVIATIFPPERLEEELKDAAARMGDLKVTSADLERELPRIFEELENMFARMPMLAAMNNARELVRPAPLGGRKGGLPDHLKAVTVEEVQARLKSYYKPANAAIVIAGAIDRTKVDGLLKKHFGGLPAGEPVPAPNEPGPPAFGSVKEITVKPPMPESGAEVCLTFVAPQPKDELYAPFLVLVVRMFGALEAADGSGKAVRVMFTPLDDPAVLTASTAVAAGETPKEAFARIEAFIERILKPRLTGSEPMMVRNSVGWMVGFADLPDSVFAQNAYGLAYSVGRQKQLGVDSAALKKAMESMNDGLLDRAKKEVFGPDRRAGACVLIEKE